VDDFAVGALMNEEAAPISQAGALVPFTSDYRSVVMNKGAMQFPHAARANRRCGVQIASAQVYATTRVSRRPTRI
jgi:hypothetical protein